MATSSVELTASRPFPPRVGPKGSLIYRLVTTTDHKLIGIMYLVTCFAFFMVGGLMALLIRAELTTPGLAFLSNEQYNQLFTMHGTAMLLFYATPIVFGFANVVLPLQIGAPDVAFPRLNALSFWLFLFGALIALAGFITPGGAADFGWTAYTPLSDAIHSPGAGGDLWILGVAVGGLGTILGAVNMITTIVCMRAPGMVMFRMPIFTWNILVVSVLVLLVFPLLAAAAIGLEADRRLGAHLYDPANGENMQGLLRSKGFCWIASRDDIAAIWSQAGPNLTIEPAQFWRSTEIAPGQEIVFIGVRLDRPRVQHLLESAVLTDDELAGGPELWRSFTDPLPAWGVMHAH
ncbi:cytochrome c oxidase subunit 1 [Mycobacteroides abscessus]|uniref:cbb3-type cytochrome c oxidase subunit I n=1 Tax=Mycobacteroides abscessus TaxID=36809 RepID=UPI0005E528F2|nr:cytochrome c oxidase subunit 1 [Mycobacteroides abscessus]